VKNLPKKEKTSENLPEDDRITINMGEQITFTKEELEGIDVQESKRFKNPDGSPRKFGVIYFTDGTYMIIPHRVALRLQKIEKEGNFKEITIARGTKGFGKYLVFIK
jgi:hypothetical protein